MRGKHPARTVLMLGAAFIALFSVVLYTPGFVYQEFYAVKKRPRVMIVMFSTPNIVPQYSGAAADINRAYAERHGYGFRHVVQEMDGSDRGPIVWKMVDILRRFVGEADAVFYIDSDACFNKPEQSLEWLFSYEANIVGCSDHPNGASYINTGTLFVRNTQTSRELLEKWWSMRHDAKYARFPYEQGALEDLAREHPADGIIARPAEEFNSIWQNLARGKRDTFVLHFMAFSAEDRAREFDTIKRSSRSS